MIWLLPICIIATVCLILVCIFNSNSNHLENFTGIPCFYQKRGSVINRDIDELECRKNGCCDELFPSTYYTRNVVDMEQLVDSHNPDTWFIQKKIWGSERKGLKLVKYGEPYDNFYEHTQQLITDSLKIRGRAFHLRIYIVVDCKHGMFLYRDGEMKYCSQLFDPNHIHKQNVISDLDESGRLTYSYQYESYLDANNLPKTLHDLYTYLGISRHGSYLESKLLAVFTRYVKMKNFCKIQEESKCPIIHRDDYKFYKDTAGYKYKHIYGADVIIKTDLTPLILEVNQRPTTLSIPKHSELLYRIPLRKQLLDNVKKDNYPESLFLRLN